MNVDSWNRKDKRPEDTVKTIVELLEKHGIKTKVVNENNYKDLWYSCRVEIEGLPSVGANGKGVTREYALASAYGEFVERYQSGFMIDKLFRCKLKAKRPSSHKFSIEDILFFFPNVFVNASQEEILAYFKAETDEYMFLSDKGTNRRILPRRLVDILCGSNGLAAGNTTEEAAVQGTAELLERHVLRQIYSSSGGLFPVLRKKSLQNLKSYKLIEAIEQKGYHVFVRDCTLGNNVPVLGVLIFDASYTKYYFKLGAEIDADISIQRSITEVFQGLDFNYSFRFKMRSLFKGEDAEDILVGCKPEKEYVRSLIDGSGLLPRSFLFETEEIDSLPSVFKMEITTNKEALKEMSMMVEHSFGELYYAKLNTTDFPTVRVLIPGISDVFYTAGDDVLKLLKTNGDIVEMFQNQEVNHPKMLELLDITKQYMSNSYSHELRNIVGIVLDDEFWGNAVQSFWLFYAFLSMHLGDRARVNHALTELNSQNLFEEKDFAEISILINGILQGKSREECLHVIDKILCRPSKWEKLIFYIKDNGFEGIGGACSSCILQKICLVDRWKKRSPEKEVK
ncbi:MAG: YcaO-like family protein [Lachnospiraceae bacterium]|nr:YcaO-like family protein [Lachnospiraceae bacterium]